MAITFSVLCTTDILNSDRPLFKWSRGGYNHKIRVGGSRLGLQHIALFLWTRNSLPLYPDVEMLQGWGGGGRGGESVMRKNHIQRREQGDPNSFI